MMFTRAGWTTDAVNVAHSTPYYWDDFCCGLSVHLHLSLSLSIGGKTTHVFHILQKDYVRKTRVGITKRQRLCEQNKVIVGRWVCIINNNIVLGVQHMFEHCIKTNSQNTSFVHVAISVSFFPANTMFTHSIISL